ncbi:hypothetical protein BT93_E2677 [Corymbia citriodora subsp. variegata]|nr:hypothetical protein BT93_E2677 [Corymbia citriodora subsp. variegata]
MTEWKCLMSLQEKKFGIKEFTAKGENAEAKTGLVLQKVVKGETQVVLGANYMLVIEAKDGVETKNYEALVWDNPGEHFRHLLSFMALLRIV